MSRSESSGTERPTRAPSARMRRLKRQTKHSREQVQLKWRRAILLAILMIDARNHLAGALQHELTISVDKLGQRQQIFHQLKPSQQLAGSSQRPDLGNPSADLIGINDSSNNNNKSRHANSTPPLTQQQLPLSLRVVPISSRGALSFVMSSGAANPSAKCSTATTTTTSTSTSSRRSFALNQQQPTSVSSKVLAVEGTNLKLNLAIVGLGAGQRHQLAPIRLRLHWQRDGQPIGDLNQARGRMASVQLAAESEPETIRHLLGLNASNHVELERSPSGWMSSVGEEQQRATTSFVLFPFVNERLLEELDRNHLASGPPRGGHTAQSLRQRIAKAHDQQQLRQLKEDRFLADGQSVDWPKLGAHLVSSLNQQHCQLDQQSQLEQLLIIQLELNQLRFQDRGQYQLLVCQQQQQQVSVAHEPTGDSLQQPGSQSTDCLQSQLVASFNLQLIEDVPRLESWFEPQLLEPGDRLSIKCEATGFTLPQISWFLDGQLLSEQPAQQHQPNAGPDGQQRSSFIASQMAHSSSALHVQLTSGQGETARQQEGSSSFRIGDYVSSDNHVHSFVNSSYGVRLSDGGFYKCQANNGLHVVEHEARIDVRGPIGIGRLLPYNVSSLAGSGRLELQCPWSGYPAGPIEWYFKAQVVAGAGPIGRAHSDPSPDYSQLDSFPIERRRALIQSRLKRHGRELPFVGDEYEGEWAGDGEGVALADEQADLPDPERDEWLAQASAMTGPPTPDEYPEPLPDYPIPVFDDSQGSNSLEPFGETDYERFPLRRTRRAAAAAAATATLIAFESDETSSQRLATASRWLKLPQSRRHQVHPNGTLTLRDIQPDDQGLYRCRVTRAAGQQPQHQADQANSSNNLSNELHLAVLVAPVISPFGSSESLREGMRNFLTCSVIGGDSPVRLAWLKDGRPIEEHISRFGSMGTPAGELGPKVAPISENPSRRIRVDSSNEFTSTLSFGHVDFRDDGNYTCLASNKAASVNYTARMVVNVPPKWIKIPKDVESVAGQSILIDCQAEAHPNPRVWWEIGVTSSSPLGAGQHHAEHTGKTSDFRPGQPDPHQSHQTSSGALEQAPNHYRTIISNSRIHILENASLVIRDLTKQDQGFYLCQAANNFGLLSSLIKLTVNVGASFANKFQMKFVRLNERVELDCDPTGQTPLTVTWFVRHHNNQNQNSNNNNNNKNEIREPNGILAGQTPIGNQLNESYASPILAGFEHLGRAIVSNNQSSSASSYARRHRQQHHGGKPDEMATNSMDDHHDQPDAIGRRRLFTGTIQTRELGAGQASGTGRSGEAKLIEIDSTISFETLKLRQPPDTTGGDKQQPEAIELVRLHIKQARRANSGDYICHAANEFGDDEKLIKLLVQEPPDLVRDVSLLQVDSRQVSLTWPAPFNGNSPISSYTLEWATLNTGETGGEQSSHTGRWSQLTIAQSQQHEQQQQQQQQQQLVATLSQLQPLTSYEIRVRAQNQFGLSPVAPSLVVTTSEEAPSAPPGDIRAIALSSNRIQLSWFPPPVAAAPSDGKQQQTPAANHKNTAASGVKGYYLGYKAANSNESFIFKTIAIPQAADGLAPAMPGKLHRLEFGNSPEASANPAARLVRAVIGDLKRSTAYSIILQAYNSAGPGPQSDPLQIRTLDNDPPPAPVLRVSQATSSSLELQWSFRPSQQLDSADSNFSPTAQQQQQQQQQQQEQQPAVAAVSDRSKQSTSPPALIEGYHLYFRPVGGVQASDSFAQANSAGSDQWQERRLSQETHVIALAQQQAADSDHQKGHQDLTIVELHRVPPAMNFANWSRFHGSNTTLTQRNFRYQLDGLTCGNFYQIYLVAYNNFGSGQPSQLVRAKTRGLVPVAPRNQADFVLANSTQVQLNLAAWQNGGCPLTNFEIKYKQLRNRLDAIAMLQSVASQAKQQDQNNSPGRNSDWLLLSNNISPEQRSIELRDVQPETWYGLWVISESAAGKTSAHFAFMTLDKLGRLPNEAVEPLPALSPDQNSDPSSMTSINNLSALFQSGASSNPIRSILVSLSGGGGGGGGGPGGHPNGLIGSPLILSACLCLILFATCLLVLIRRYNSLAKDDQSVDLRLARSSHPGSKSFQGTMTSEATHHLDGGQYGVKSHHYAMATPGGQPLSEETRSISPLDTHYSLRVSPSKTGATVITNSSSSTNGSSSGALLLPGSTAATQCDGAHLAYGTVPNHNLHHHHLQQELSGAESNHEALQQHVPMEQLGQFVACSAATLNPQHRNSRIFGKDYNKFSTLNQHHHLSQAQPVVQDEPLGGGMPSACFRTLPHQNLRPVSTFLPHGNVQHLNNCQLEQSQNSSQDYNNYQQQIYSKLRLLQHFEEAPMNGSCNAMCQLQQQQQQQQQQQASNEAATVALNQLLGQASSSLVGDQQIQADQNGCTSSITCQQQSAAANNGGPNEQDDYALPFPPKWV